MNTPHDAPSSVLAETGYSADGLAFAALIDGLGPQKRADMARDLRLLADAIERVEPRALPEEAGGVA